MNHLSSKLVMQRSGSRNFIDFVLSLLIYGNKAFGINCCLSVLRLHILSVKDIALASSREWKRKSSKPSRFDSYGFELLLGSPGIAGAHGPQEQNG